MKVKVIVGSIYILLALASWGIGSNEDPLYLPFQQQHQAKKTKTIRSLEPMTSYSLVLTVPQQVVEIDSYIYDMTNSNITWFVETPGKSYIVKHCTDLVEADWVFLGVHSTNTYVHNNPDGFYKVSPLSPPPPPPPPPPGG
jgi:hypothetical protein